MDPFPSITDSVVTGGAFVAITVVVLGLALVNGDRTYSRLKSAFLNAFRFAGYDGSPRV